MITLLIVLLALFGGISMGYFMGYNHKTIEDKIEALTTPEPVIGVVNPNSPEVMPYESSSVVSPKTPSQIEREAELALRKRNGL